jgi:hypothetical protein
MTTLNMTYNSQREDIVISEYGRTVQNLLENAKSIEDKEQRQLTVERIVDLVAQLFPQSKTVDDYRLKIWKHILRISKYELDVTPPEGVNMDPEQDYAKPDELPYPKTENKFRHYGAHVQKLIKKANAMEEGPIKEEFVRVIASYMKTAYRTWNKEHFVSDDVIKDDLKLLSGGTLEVHESATLNEYPLNAPSQNRKRKRNPGSNPSQNQMSKRFHNKNKRR